MFLVSQVSLSSCNNVTLTYFTFGYFPEISKFKKLEMATLSLSYLHICFRALEADHPSSCFAKSAFPYTEATSPARRSTFLYGIWKEEKYLYINASFFATLEKKCKRGLYHWGNSFMYHCIKNVQQNIDTKSKDPSHQPSFIGACSLTHRFATGLLESFSHLYHWVAFTCP